MAAALPEIAGIAILEPILEGTLQATIAAASEAALEGLTAAGIDTWIATVATEAAAEGATVELSASAGLFRAAGMSAADAQSTMSYLVEQLVTRNVRALTASIGEDVLAQLVSSGLPLAGVAFVRAASSAAAAAPPADTKVLALRDRVVVDVRKAIAAGAKPQLQKLVQKVVNKAAKEAGALTERWAKQNANDIRSKALAAVFTPSLLEGAIVQSLTFEEDAKRRYAAFLRLALRVEGALAALLEGKGVWEQAKKAYLGGDEYKALMAKAVADAAELQGATAVQAVAATAAAA